MCICCSYVDYIVLLLFGFVYKDFAPSVPSCSTNVISLLKLLATELLHVASACRMLLTADAIQDF